MKLEGIYTPLVTPFRGDGSFDLDALADLVERLVAAGVHGLISGGSTGENYAETVDER
ncbi:4-hydroxy-tetrahydrodipicolinate synthase, partial [Paracoccus versutus]